MIGALIHFILNTAFVVVLAVVVAIVFVISWPFLYIRRRLVRARRPRLRLKSSIDDMPAASSVEANIYRTETIFSRRKFAASKAQCAASFSAGNGRKPTSFPPNRDAGSSRLCCRKRCTAHNVEACHSRFLDPSGSRQRRGAPRRNERGAAVGWHPINKEVEGLARGGVTPVHVLVHHQHGLSR